MVDVGEGNVALTQAHSLQLAGVAVGVASESPTLYLGPPIRDVHTAIIVMPVVLTGVVDLKTVSSGEVILNPKNSKTQKLVRTI